jgi:hypothetical protein
MICPAEIVFWKNVPVTRHSTQVDTKYHHITYTATIMPVYRISSYPVPFDIPNSVFLRQSCV